MVMTSSRTRSGVLSAVLLAGALTLACKPATTAEPTGALPATKVVDLAGGEASLATLATGKPLLVWFWAPW
jgi:hypothetical protein